MTYLFRYNNWSISGAQHRHPSGYILIGMTWGFLLFLNACARPGAPTGGPKDNAAPKIDSAASTPNMLTRFDRKTITLKFDEWVTLSEQNTQIIVSPPLKTKRVPEVVLKGKTVVVKIPEEEQLRPNTTYTINFGNAVKDLHEGNPAKDLRYVFSTGDYIDSLTVLGKVIQAYSAEPVENAAIMLYENLADSVPVKEKPYYYTRSDKQGAFQISNVRSGTFKIIAIEDKDQNLLWNGSDEIIGFLDAPLLRNDTFLGIPLTIRMHKNQSSRVRLSEKTTLQYGQMRLQYNAPPDSITFGTLPEDKAKLLIEKNVDSVLIWYDLRDTTPIKLLAGPDTVAVRNFSRTDFMKVHQIGWAGESSTVRSGRGKTQTANTPAQVLTIIQNPARAANLAFSFPIMAYDTALWVMRVDSQVIRNLRVNKDSLRPRQLNFSANWLPEKTHELLLLPGAITDFWGKINSDTLRRKFTIIGDKQLGDLNLTVDDLVPGTHYLLELLNGNKVEETRFFKAETASKKLIFNKLIAGTYNAELTEDLNANARRDAGDYFKNRLPERVFKKELTALRPGWEVEAGMKASEVQEAKKTDKK
jgi:Bacterial Ig-like domain